MRERREGGMRRGGRGRQHAFVSRPTTKTRQGHAPSRAFVLRVPEDLWGECCCLSAMARIEQHTDVARPAHTSLSRTCEDVSTQGVRDINHNCVEQLEKFVFSVTG